MLSEHGMTLIMEEMDPEEGEDPLLLMILEDLVEVGYVLLMILENPLVILKWIESLTVLKLETKQRRLQRLL